MLGRKSRYASSKAFTNNNGFKGLRARKTDFAQGRIEHTVIATDRLDHLADDYYKDDRHWWRIMDANPEYLYGFEMVTVSGNGSPPEKTDSKKRKDNMRDPYGEVILIPAGSGK